MMKKTLYGNGKPQESVVTQVHSMKKSVGRLELIGWGLIAWVLGSIGGKVIDRFEVMPVANPAMTSSAMTSPVVNAADLKGKP